VLVASLIPLPRTVPLYGQAEWAKPEYAEPEETTTPTTPAVPTSITTPPAVVPPVLHDDFSAEGWSVLEKGLFLAVILGCIAVYLRMSNKKDKRFREKSMV